MLSKFTCCKTLNDLLIWFNIEDEYKFQKDSKVIAGQIKRVTEIIMKTPRSKRESTNNIRQSIRIEL